MKEYTLVFKKIDVDIKGEVQCKTFSDEMIEGIQERLVIFLFFDWASVTGENSPKIWSFYCLMVVLDGK